MRDGWRVIQLPQPPNELDPGYLDHEFRAGEDGACPMTTAAPPVETAPRLDMRQMAQFVMDGFIEFDDLVPEDLNAAVHEEQLRAPTDARWEPKIPDAFLDTSPATQAVLELPRVKAVLATLLGPSYIHDHSYLHITPAGLRSAQSWHVDHDRDGRRLTREDFLSLTTS